MRIARRHVLIAFLIGLMGLTSAAMASARAGMSLHGAMVLCIGAETTRVPLGPDGRPQDGAHVCVDCVIGALALPGHAPAAAQPTDVSGLTQTQPATVVQPGAPPQPTARAPPPRPA